MVEKEESTRTYSVIYDICLKALSNLKETGNFSGEDLNELKILIDNGELSDKDKIVKVLKK